MANNLTGKTGRAVRLYVEISSKLPGLHNLQSYRSSRLTGKKKVPKAPKDESTKSVYFQLAPSITYLMLS